jgi:hypothetical protein
VYAKVECIGFTAMDEGDCTCSSDLKIRAKVVGTGSVITFSACNWLDTLEEVELDCDLNRRKAKAYTDYRTVVAHHFLARRRLALQAYLIDSMSATDQKAFKEDLAENKLDMKTLDEHKLKEYARTAVLVANGIEKDQAERWYD